MASARLQFRRHLAACCLVLILNELAGQEQWAPPSSASFSNSPSHLAPGGTDKTTSSSILGPHRVRVASAAATPTHGSHLQRGLVRSRRDNTASGRGEAAATPTAGGLQNSAGGSAMNDDQDDSDLVGATLAFVGAYLPTINFNYTLLEHRFENHQLDTDVEDYYTERFSPNLTLDQLHLLAIKAAVRLAPMPLHTSWGYETREQLRLASWPVQDDSRCSAHLGQLTARLERMLAGPTSGGQVGLPVPGETLQEPVFREENFEAQLLYKSRDVELLRYLDTFGRVPSDLLRGNVRWYGSFSGCLDTKLTRGVDVSRGGTKRIKFRYCQAALKSLGWQKKFQWPNNNNKLPNGTNTQTSNGQMPAGLSSAGDKSQWTDYGVHTHDLNLENFFFRVGVCLPESCDSSAIDYQDNARHIEKLLKFNLMKPFNSDHYYLADLYCIPDQRSPLRTIPLLGKLLILGSLAWMGLIGLATMVHLNVERFYRKAVKEIREKENGLGQRGKGAGAGLRTGTGTGIGAGAGAGIGSGTGTGAGGAVGSGSEYELDGMGNGKKRPDSSAPNSDEAANNEFQESDILHLKRNWLRLNVFIYDHSKRLVSGVDLIACLSLYSNWLKYTRRLKLAVAQLHAEEERHERKRMRNEQLVEQTRLIKQRQTASKETFTQAHTAAAPGKQSQGGGGGHSLAPKLLHSGNEGPGGVGRGAGAGTGTGGGSDDGRGSAGTLVSESQSSEPMSDSQLFERELKRRLEAQDDLDELESDNVKRRVDTSSLNALKVIALVWIIAGHCIFYLGSSISNGAILKNYARDLAAFALANGAMYITELFFVITGCLTTYLAFKYNSFQVSQARGEEEAGVDDEHHLDSQADVANSNAGEWRSQVNSEEPAADRCSRLGGGPTGDTSTTTNRRNTRANRAANDGAKGRKSASSKVVMKPTSEAPAPVVYLESRMFKIPFWLSISAHRYLRILPTYLLVYAYVKLVSVYVGGYGQLWDYAVSPNSMRRNCVQESWLPVLTLTTNFISIYDHCIVGGWYLSVDMQFMLMALPILIVMAQCQRSASASARRSELVGTEHFAAFSKQSQQLTFIGPGGPGRNMEAASGPGIPGPGEAASGKGIRATLGKRMLLAYGLVVALGLVSGGLAIGYGMVQDTVDLSILLRFVPHAVAILSRNIALYTNSLFRFRAFAFGLILGHLLYLYEFRLLKLPKFIQQHGAKLTTAIFSTGFCIMFLPVIYPMGKILVSHDMTAIFMILTAGGVDIFLCTLIFLICIGKAPKVVLFVLNSPFWSILSPLSLCAFLVHTEIIVVLSSQLDPPPAAQYSLLLFVFSATLLLTYLLAVGLYLSFEMPLSALIEALMRKYLAGSKLVRSDNPAAPT